MEKSIGKKGDKKFFLANFNKPLKKISWMILFIVVCFTNIAIAQSDSLLIDDFEDGNYNFNPRWILPDLNKVTELISTIVPGANNTQYALSLRFTILKDGWATLYVYKDDPNGKQFNLFNLKGSNRICFYAKALTENTHEMSIHILEDDLTRWICYVELSKEWQKYVLDSSQFIQMSPHPDIKLEDRKKRENTKINIENIRSLAFVVEDTEGEKGFIIDEIYLQRSEQPKVHF